MKNLFRVNFPAFEDFFQEWFINCIPDFSTDSAADNFKKDNHQLIDVINKDYHNYKNIDWTKGKVVIFWHAPLIPLPIHSDVSKLDNSFKLGHAVSFNLFNTATVNLYDVNELTLCEEYIRPTDSVTTPDLETIYTKFENTQAIAYNEGADPIETHHIAVNDTYIMNTVTPHKLLAEPGRIHVSVRCSHFNDTPWSNMVDFFKDDIKL